MMNIQRMLLGSLCFLFLFSCQEKEEALTFLGKNPYQEHVWEELLQQDKVKFEEIEQAFRAYASTHNLDESVLEHFEKLERYAKDNMNSEGYLYSEQFHLKELLSYRKATPNTAYEVPVTPIAFGNNMTYDIPNPNSMGSWRNIGPFGNPEVQWSATGNGALDYVEMHPTNPAIMYACSRNAGLWRTDDYGSTWTPMTQHFNTPHVGCIEVCEADPTILYLSGRQDEIIWYSTDEGFTWENRSNGMSGNIYDLKSDPNNSDHVLAATDEGVFLSTDAGLNWTKKIDARFVDIDVTEDWSLIILSDDNADIAPNLYFSQDKGVSFTTFEITDEYTEIDRAWLSMYESTHGIYVYALLLVDGNSPTRWVGMFESAFDASPADGTSYFNFTRRQHPTHTYPNGPVALAYADNADGFTEETEDYYGSINPYTEGTWISDFWVSPNDSLRLLTLREKFWGSEDGGIIWRERPSYGGSNWADNRYVTMNVAKDTIFWCNDGGLWAMAESDIFPSEADVTASGLSHGAYMRSKVVPKNGNICVAEGSQMDVSQMNKDVFMTGGQDIGQIFVRNGRDSHVASADVYRGRMKPSDDSKFITGALKINLDGGTDEFEVYNNINADYHNPDRLYGFTTKNNTTNTNDVRLVRSPNGEDGWLVNGFRGENQANSGGHSWVATYSNWETVDISTSSITNLKAGTFEQSRANAELAFLGDESGNKLFMTNDLSSATPTWTELTNAPAATRYRIATHPYNENLVAIATNIGVYVSKDKGQTWTQRGTFPETQPRVILLDRNKSEGIYVMTALTVYYMDENLTNWAEYNKGQPLQKNNDMRMAYYADGDHRLYVSKYGMGVWATPLQSALEANNELAFADFRIHGESSNNIQQGESVRLTDLSLGADSISWRLENGTDIINIGNIREPSAQLNTLGYYQVTQFAYNAAGTRTAVKTNYIKVIAPLPTLACTPLNDGNTEWYRHFRTIKMDEEAYNVSGSTAYYIESGYTFTINSGQATTLYMDDSYQPGFNQYMYAWIDYNNNGDFEDAGEQIAASPTQVDTLIQMFTPPASAVVNEPIQMRVMKTDNSSPTSCYTTNNRQIIEFAIEIRTNVNFTAQSHQMLTQNSATLDATYTDGMNVLEAGFVYSLFDADLNLENANRVSASSTLSDDDSYSIPISDLSLGGTYYYRPYVIDDSGISYGAIQSFQLSAYESPLVEALEARFLGNDQWELTGTLYVGTNTNINATFQHGLGNFNTSTAATLPTINAGDEVTIQTIVTAPMSMNNYQFRIEVKDSGYSYYSNTITFDLYQMTCDENMGTGEVLNEIWTDVEGTNVADFTSLATYPDMPDEVHIRTNGFQGINGFGFNYGSKLSAMLCPPQSGNYTFWIAGDDDCELWLSTSASEAGIRRIAYFDGWTNVDEWDKYSSQNSNNVVGQIYLNAGQTYFLQALHKEGTGGDHVAVRWQLPDNTIENPIAPQHLSLPNPYQGVCEDTNINITTNPLSNDYRRASQTITTTGTVEVDVALEVTFQAGQSITLAEGFHAKSDFTARIAECVTTTSSNANEEIVEERTTSVAPSLSLQVQPNPAQDYTNVVYELAESGEVQISLFDLQGRRLQQFSQVEQNVGTHQLELDLTKLEAGIYLAVLRTKSGTITRKVMISR